ILVVDDSDSVRELVSKGLGRLGYRVLTAASAEQAMEVSAREAEVDLLLADVVMPGMDGVELVRGIRAARPEVKVLFISGYEREAVARRGVVEGGTSLLPKPFLLEDLARSVRAMFLPPAGAAPTTSG
ncbi:MAG TPA: response regulator, partial [Spirochaetia bacterium]|nr:response regulator [Spirochaetia bacterium]